ncbi:MAG: hypothetical protein Q7J08_00015 [Methanocorpusculum sp.]|uniref:hypothetical protein n=1 Tax=Methanocorpusculum sp. TaxID=2058474 RepID=UPI002720FF3F|nr:hypothetical protein [Methanocorpusculum sp.]MDO9522091.1 hypothetical protein [Methanocorpusculum sp.]
MAVQTKSKSEDKGPKKKINWTQVGVIGFCVLIVFMCIVSFSGLPNAFGNLINGDGTTGTGAVVAGNPVYVNYTMNIGGSAVFENAMGFNAGSEVNQSLYVSIEGYDYPFVIYATEFNQISSGVIGLIPGESKTVAGSGSNLAYQLTKEEAETSGLVFDDMKVDDRVFITVEYTNEDGEAAKAYRVCVVTAKTDDSLTLQYGTDTIDIKMVGYLTTS